MAQYRFNPDELKRRRIESGKKPELVALQIDRTKEAYVAYERGVSIPPTGVLFALCDILDCDPGDLLVQVDDAELDEQTRQAMIASRAAQGLPIGLADDELEDAAALLRLSNPK